ncbi:MAG: serine/threonine-protein kinase [Thermoanaerobaculia bacterium]|nr:serine/threonine-protein kinase [Thermoanaerobaculia bacterium]
MIDDKPAPGDWSTADWYRLDELYASCLELPATERLGKIGALRAHEPLLANRLEALLEADQLASRFLEQPAALLLDPEFAGELTGRSIGPYRIESHLGAGGMGTVYRARHEDERLDRVVALKLIRAGARGDLEFQRRFERECRILAGLEHPGIARLYDGGTSADGVAYLVMEYVDGRPIDGYCREHRLGVTEILRLFVKVGEAVAFAHANLVVHRDLKTGNILVAANGEPKLLDFGIAASLAETTAEPAADANAPQPRTPAYAAPEQLSAGQPTPATDVYSLGVVLYQLLTGQLPLSPAGKTPEEHDRALLEQVPEAPSRAVLTVPGPLDAAARRLRARQLSGDLDAILAKALVKSPADRYPTAAALTEDLVRHLEFRPVVARPATPGYRVRRFCRRFRVQVAAAALVALALVGTAVTTTLQARRIAQERDRALAAQRAAEQERDRAERTSNLVTDIFEGVDLSATQGPDALDRVLSAVRRNLLDFRDPGVAKAAALSSLAEVHNDLGRSEAADELLVASLALTANAAPGTAEALERIRAQVVQAEVLLGRRQPREAEALARRAHDELMASSTPPAGLVAMAKNHLALSLLSLDRTEEGERLLSEAVLLVEAHPDRAEASYAQILHNHASAALRRGDLQLARERFERALDSARRTRGERSDQAARALAALGSTLTRLERYGEAEAIQRGALEVLRERLGERHPDVLETLNNLAVSLRQVGQVDESARLHCEGLALRREVFGSNSIPVAQTLQNLGYVFVELGHPELADRSVSSARKILDQAQASPALRAGAWAVEGTLASLEGRLDAARESLTKALALARSGVGNDHPMVADILTSLAWTELAAGRRAEAGELATAAHGIFEKKLGAASSRTAWAELVAAGARGDRASVERAFEQLGVNASQTGNPVVRRAAYVLDMTLGDAPWPASLAGWRPALAPPPARPLPADCPREG